MQNTLSLANTTVVNAASMGAPIISAAIDLSGTSYYSIQAIWSAGASPIGNLVLRGSNDPKLLANKSDNTAVFSDISTVAVSGNSGDTLFNVEKAGYAFVRLEYQRTSGTATLNAYYNSKT